MKLLKFKSNLSPTISDKEARRLTTAFLDGDTTPEQERTLYDYYRGGGRVADDLECYRQMFAWYADLENSAKSEPDRRSGRPRLAIAAAVTALVLIGVGFTVGKMSDLGESSFDRMYAGSYIIRNGKKITDINEILPELRKADRIVDSTLTASVLNYPDNPDVIIINEAVKNITDPDVREILLADLN